MSESRAPRMAIKEGELFLYSDGFGHLPESEHSALGLYFHDTRFLSRLELKLGGRPPVLLSSTAERNYMATMEFTNLELRGPGDGSVPQASIHLRRTRFVADRVFELLRVRNFGNESVEFALDLYFDADFADLFEVRGTRRTRRGTLLAPKWEGRTLTLAYLGVDEILRKTLITFEEEPESVQQSRVRFHLALAPRERRLLRFDIQVVEPGAPEPVAGDFNARLGAVHRDYERWTSESADIFTDNEQFSAVLRRSQNDLRMLAAPTEYGNLLLAGIPWFVAPFGRDMILASIETLMLDTRFAVETVRAVTRLQGKVDNVYREEEPGKIFHEIRQGELANLKAIPHTPYLRRHRHDAALPAAPLRGRHVERRPRVLRAAARAHRGGAGLDHHLRRPRRRRVRGVPAALARRPGQPGLARCPQRDRARRRHDRPRGPSRSPTCRATCTTPSAVWRRSTDSSATSSCPSVCRRRRRSSSGASTSASGWRTSSSWPWRWTATRSR